MNSKQKGKDFQAGGEGPYDGGRGGDRVCGYESLKEGWGLNGENEGEYRSYEG